MIIYSSLSDIFIVYDQKLPKSETLVYFKLMQNFKIEYQNILFVLFVHVSLNKELFKTHL